MRGLVLVLCAAWIAAVFGGTIVARAEALTHGGLTLEWTAPPGCPQASATLERIRSLLGVSPDAARPVQARGSVQRSAAGGWELVLETAQGEQRFERSVRAQSCEEVTDAGALIVALAIDPKLQSREPRPEPQPESEAPAPAAAEPPRSEAQAQPEPPPPSSDRVNVARRPEPGVAFAVVAAALGDLGTLPRPALGAELGAELALPSIQLELVGILLPEARETIAPSRGGDISLLAGGLRVCYAARGRLSGLACAGAELGRLQGTGVGTSWRDTQGIFWAAGRAGVAASYALSTVWALRAGLDAIVPVSRPEFVLENVGPVHRPSQVAARLELGLELSF